MGAFINPSAPTPDTKPSATTSTTAPPHVTFPAIFVLGQVDGLDEVLAEVGKRLDCARFDVAADDGREKAAEGAAEVVGGEVFAGEVAGDAAAEFVFGEGFGFFAGVVKAEMRVMVAAGHAAFAVVGEGELADGGAGMVGCRRGGARWTW